jgi:hypothetical protein
VGTDFEFSAETFVRPTVIVRARPGEEGTNSAFLAVDGTYVVDCTLFEEGQRIHTWWPEAEPSNVSGQGGVDRGWGVSR